MSVTSRKQAIIPAADMQWRARKIAMQASKLADKAGPMTKRSARTARRKAGTAAGWAKPRVGRARAWLAVRAARGSVSVQETVAPRVSAMLAIAARKLDPPQARSRRWPKVLAGTALLAAGAAAATAMAMRKRTPMRAMPQPMPRTPQSGKGSEQPTVLNPSAETERERREAEVNGLSRTR